MLPNIYTTGALQFLLCSTLTDKWKWFNVFNMFCCSLQLTAPSPV